MAPGAGFLFLEGYDMNKCGPQHGNWKSGETVCNGRHKILMRNHSRADCNGYVYRYMLIAEKSLGKPLPTGTQIHHIDENASNDEPKNLIICEDRSYHKLLHRRKRALETCGHASWRKCGFCHEYDKPENLYINKNNTKHSKCDNEYRRNRRATKKALS